MIATDVDDKKVELPCRYETLDVTDKDKFAGMVKDNKIDYIVHLAAILSALGEKIPDVATNVNIFGSVYALNIARDNNC